MTVDTIEHKGTPFTQLKVLDGLICLTLGCSFVTALFFIAISSLKIIDHLRGVSHIFALDFSSALLLANAIVTLVLLPSCAALLAWSKFLNARVKKHSG